MNKKFEECADRLRKLVSDVQGAPYPSDIQPELYLIWYEHLQKNAMDCFEFLNENFPNEKDDVGKRVKSILKK